MSAYWTVELPGPTHAVRILPDACVDLTLDLRRPSSPRPYVAATQKHARDLTLQGEVRLLGARLFPGSARLLGIQVAELSAEEWTPLDRFLVADDVRQLTAAVGRARSWPARIGALDAFLVDRLVDREIDPTLSRALAALFACDGALTMAELSASVSVGPRTLTRLFASWIGLSPKCFARIVRFQAALRKLPGSDNWAALAAEMGYFDQSHFIRELKHLFGTTPTDALELAGRTR